GKGGSVYSDMELVLLSEFVSNRADGRDDRVVVRGAAAAVVEFDHVPTRAPAVLQVRSRYHSGEERIKPRAGALASRIDLGQPIARGVGR
ncbi:MAG: hypothetical protein KGM43_16925, partial [Planctomycetota bacterium]|nr:hypothetical protein [Planctomycetota bacterium]